MPKPSSLAEFGTVLPTADVRRPTGHHARFLDVKNYATGSMPEVQVGQVYADLDPRCVGRRVQVLRVDSDARVLVRTVTPRTCPPRTPSVTSKDTTGAVSFIALRRFRENARGFRLLSVQSLHSAQSYLLGARIAEACDLPLRETEIRAAEALIALLGDCWANLYLDELKGSGHDAAPALYRGGDLSALFSDAVLFADEMHMISEWKSNEVAPKATVRLVVQI